MIKRLPNTGIDWQAYANDGAFSGDVAARADMIGAVNDYFVEVSLRPVNAAPDANFAAQPMREVTSFSIGETGVMDFVFELFFREVNMLSASTGTYKMIDASSGLSFAEILPGERMKTSDISSTAQTVSVLEYGAGLNILDIWLADNEMFRVEDLVQAAVRKWSRFRANLHYLLLNTAGAANTIVFDTSLAQTIDNACNTILDALGDKFGLTDGEPVHILTHARNGMRVAKALAATFDNPNSNNDQVQANIASYNAVNNANVPPTFDFGAGSVPYADIILPGHQLVSLRRRDLTAEEQRDAAKRGSDLYWSGRFNAALGESRQIVRIPLA